MECERQNSFLCWWLADPESSYFGSVEVISLARDSSNKNYILFVTKHDTMTWENITEFGNIHFQPLHICKSEYWNNDLIYEVFRANWWDTILMWLFSSVFSAYAHVISYI